MEELLMGAITMASWTAALFFLRFWRKSGDRLFLSFAAAFALLGLTRLALTFVQQASESHTYLYLIRLLAFVLILVAIVDKNRR